MFMKRVFAASVLTACSTGAFAACETNVDKVEVFYINGMFTDWSSYRANLQAIEEFVQSYLFGWGFSPTVHGAHNESENAISQVIEVARQKFEDANASAQLAIKQFLNNDPEYVNTPEGVAAVKEFLTDINSAYTTILAEADTANGRAGLVSLLDTCSRVVMITHSQGNFYGNALFNDLYATYDFPNGYSLAQYPMLGNMQIASPVYNPGGAAGIVYPDSVGHLTNDTDLVMGLVRGKIGAVDSNYDASINPNDFSGHGLEQSYLKQPGQAAQIAGNIANIAFGFTPYPLHGQRTASSSAFDGYGFTEMNELLDIEFGSGGVYRYSDVPESTFNGLLSASSKGGYFNEYIRDRFSFEKLE